MRILKTPANIAPGIVAGKEGTVRVHRPTTNLALASLLFLVAALVGTPALAAPRAEALSHTRSVPGQTVTSGPGDPEEMEAFLDTLTPIDMAAFMIAHLHEGAYGDVRILEAATAAEMHRQQFTHHPDLPGMCYGFKERFINGRRGIGHGGDIHTFASQMILIPEEDLGFFVAYNRFDDAFREQLISAFFDRYYPAQDQRPLPQAIEMSPEQLERFAGSYRWVRYPRSTIGKAIALVPGPYPIIVEANQDTSLSLSFFGADAAWRYVPVGQNVFKQVDGGPQELGGLLIDPGETLAFRENQAGEATYGFVPLQNTAFEKLAWYESAATQMGTMGSLLLLFASAVVVWPLGALIRRLRKRNRESNPAWRRLGRFRFATEFQR